MAAEIKDQQGWADYGLTDLRQINEQYSAPAPDEIKKADSLEEAISVLAQVFGLGEKEDSAIVKTFIGDIVVKKDNLEHIVEKRKDSRERYANHAFVTVTNPFEIWLTKYDNGDKRYIFIGLLKCKRQMLVIVSIWEDKFLWNFMHTDKKNLNKHRRGELIYSALKIQKAANQ